MAQQDPTPGVYIQERNAFPAAIVGVPTAVPLFIGYTEQAPAALTPTPITSFAEFQTLFGTDFKPQFTPNLTATANFCLYRCVQLFFLNGGTTCYIVSVGDFSHPVSRADLLGGLNAAANQIDATFLVIPDATLLRTFADFQTLAQAMLQQAGTLQNRMALLDVYGAQTLTQAELPTALTPLIEQFQSAFGSPYLSYGAAYFPWLNTTLYSAGEIDASYFDPAPAALTPALQQAAADALNLIPASGAVAGLYMQNDAQRGVWNAPANLFVSGVLSPGVNLTNEQQSELNTPLNGVAVNAIRSFPARGTLVWGARTLDGNNNDFRYISARRTIIYIEQSIKQALQQYLFSPNDAATWTAVTQSVSTFLTGIWREGALIGPKPADAFFVTCGLDSTMTAQDILNGDLIVELGVALLRPAEFIIIRLEQQTQTT